MTHALLIKSRGMQAGATNKRTARKQTDVRSEHRFNITKVELFHYFMGNNSCRNSETFPLTDSSVYLLL